MAEESKIEDAARVFAAQYTDWVSGFYPTKGDFEQLGKRWPLITLHIGDDDIEEIVAFRQQQRRVKRRSYITNRVERIKETIADHLLDELLEKVRASINGGQDWVLKSKIRQAIKDMDNPYDYEEMAATVEMVLEGKYTPQTKNSNYKTYLSYAWTIGIDLISLFVLFAIFSSTTDNQQKLLLAILMLIYLAVRSLGLGIGWAVLPGLMGLEAELQRIRGLLYEELGKEELEKAAEIKKVFNRSAGKSIIDSIFLGIAYLATVWILLSALGIV